MTTPNYSDERIAKLPGWARALIQHGYDAHRRGEYWHGEYIKATDKIDQVREDHARTNGAAEYDTWVADDKAAGSDSIPFGLGVGRPVEFGQDDAEVGLFSVRYRDGGLDIDGLVGEMVIKPSRYGGTPALRIEAA